MVVLAGLVGAGGLGAEVTRGLTRLDFGLGLRASLAIVALAIVMDRVFRGAIPAVYLPKAKH
ncbi:Glycine betaine transport system permease protein OpuAB [compost metagenome]